MEPDCSVGINETTNLADNIPTWVGVWVGVGGAGTVERDTVTTGPSFNRRFDSYLAGL